MIGGAGWWVSEGPGRCGEVGSSGGGTGKSIRDWGWGLPSLGKVVGGVGWQIP